MENETITVLLVDDDPTFAKIAQHLLTRYQGRKFDLIWKQDGDQAIAEVTSNPAIQVILMDYYLSGMNGLEISKSLAERSITVPIIFLTTYKDFQVAVEAMKYGVQEYLMKDEVTGMALPKTILSVLERVHVKRRIADAEKQEMLTQKRGEAIRELIVTICHEFNNPLAAIKISSDIISRQPLTEDERALMSAFDRNLEELEKEVKKLRDIHWDMDLPKQSPLTSGTTGQT